MKEKKQKNKIQYYYTMKHISFKDPQVIVCIGRPKQGKSNAVKYLLLKNMINKDVFKFGIVFTRTKFNEGYDYIPEKYIYTEYKPEILKKYMDGLEELKKKKGKIPTNFIIFDDQQGLLNRNDPTLTNFVASHRHYNTTCFFCFQYLYGASPLLRECTTYALMFRSFNHRTINGLYENFGQLFESEKEFKKYFLKNTKKIYTALLYDQSKAKLKKNYLRFKAPNMDNYKDFKLDY